jgi:hypothetical protein
MAKYFSFAPVPFRVCRLKGTPPNNRSPKAKIDDFFVVLRAFVVSMNTCLPHEIGQAAI